MSIAESNNREAIRRLGTSLPFTGETIPRKLFQLVMRNISDAVMIVDASGHIEYLNPTAEQMTGWLAEEARSQHYAQVFQLVTDQGDAPEISLIEKAMAVGRALELETPVLLQSREGRKYTLECSATTFRNTEEEIEHVVVVFRDRSPEVNIERKLHHLEQHDHLTGLKNRNYFEQQLRILCEQVGSQASQGAVLILNVDHFKVINETIGHDGGDYLLIELAHLLRARLRQTDLISRIGGDEFGVILYQIDEGKAFQVARELMQKFEEYQFSWEGHTFDIRPSIGISVIHESNRSVSEILRQATVACRSAKNLGGNKVRSYHQKDDDILRKANELRIVRAIKEALSEKRFELHFQPVIQLADRTICMHEVLLRMRDNHQNLISPGFFIPVAEAYGLMVELDKFVIRSVIDNLHWQTKHGTSSGILMINLSGLSLGHPEIIDMLVEKLRSTPVDPGHLLFEITETAAVDQLEKAKLFMDEIRSLGCRFALDDFGTGFSSFSYLRHMPVDYVKIDGSFVKNMVLNEVDQALVRSINQVAHSTGKATIGECVENEETLNLMIEMGIDYAQGYHIARPMPQLMNGQGSYII